MDAFETAVQKIIKAQEGIIGPLAVEQAQKVDGLKIDSSSNKIILSGDEKKILQSLVEKYEGIFGQTSVEVCKHAVRDILPQLPQDQIPPLLR